MNISVEKKKRVRKSREERMSEIIAAATQIFTREGYSELTLRRVAKDVGVRLSTVQYYFESKEQLLSELLITQDNKYTAQKETFRSESEGDPEKLFSSYLYYLLDSSAHLSICCFFTQLWALAFQSDECSIKLVKMYEGHCEGLADMIHAMNSTLDRSECLHRATLISSMIEGSMIHIGKSLPVKLDSDKVREMMHKQLMLIASA